MTIFIQEKTVKCTLLASVSLDVYFAEFVYEAYTILKILRLMPVRSNVRRTEALTIAEDC